MAKKYNTVYGFDVPLVEVPHVAKSISHAPTVNDKDYALGDVVIYKPTADSGTSYVFCGTDSSGQAIWALQSPSPTEIEEIECDNGDNITATSGVIILAGGTNLSTTASDSPATVTIDLDDAISVATSVTSPLFTADSADAVIKAGGANDVIAIVGDNDGATSFKIQDIDEADVFKIDSNGDIDAKKASFKAITADLIGTSGICIPKITQNALVNSASNTGVVATGTTGDVNNVYLQTGVNLNAFVIGAGQTILQPIMTANGLEIGGDQAASEGYEYNLPYQKYTIGTDAAFFFELGLYVNDMDGAAPFVFGFRKEEANNGTFTAYTDYASIGLNAVTSAVNIATLTNLNNAGQVATDSTQAWGGDGATNTLRVDVSSAGVVTYAINGTTYAGAGFTFDNGDVVIPFIRVEQSANPTDVAITSMKIGYQA